MNKKNHQQDPKPPAANELPPPDDIDELRQAAAEAEELREHLLRVRADFANARKRQERDMQEYRQYALQDFVASLLPGLDDLQRAIAAADATHDVAAFRNGVEMVLASLLKALDDAGVKPVPTEGEPFDPAVHEAVVVEASPDVDRPTVADRIRAGYTLGDRVIRPAQVRVAMPPDRAEPDADDDADEGSV